MMLKKLYDDIYIEYNENDFTCRLEMNSPLDQDFKEFKLTNQRKTYEDDAVDDLQKFGMFFF